MIRPYRDGDGPAIVDLWRRCDLLRPWNDPEGDIERKLACDPEMLLVAEEDGAITGSVMVGDDGHRGWVNYLAVDPGRRRLGIGAALMAEAERLLIARGCVKLNLQIRSENHEAAGFYARLGYGIDDVISMGRRLIDRD